MIVMEGLAFQMLVEEIPNIGVSPNLCLRTKGQLYVTKTLMETTYSNYRRTEYIRHQIVSYYHLLPVKMLNPMKKSVY